MMLIQLLYLRILFFCRLLTTTETYFNDSKDDDVLRNSEPETFDGSIKLQIVIFIVYGFDPLRSSYNRISCDLSLHKRKIQKR